MSDRFDHQSFDRSVIPGGFSKDVVETVEGAVLFGWTLFITGKGSMTIKAPVGEKKFHFSTRRKSGPLARIRRDIVRNADPGRLAILQGVNDGALPKSMVDVLVALQPDVTMARPEDEPKSEKAKKPIPKYIVSQRPMLAKSGETQGYESKTTIERHWSDGTVDYKCARCDFTTTKRKSVSAHWPKHVREDESARSGPNVTFRAEVPNATSYAPRKARIEALAAYLRGLDFPEGNIDVEVIAKAALTWQHEQSKHRTPLAAEAEELDEHDVLERIRALLDRGERSEYQRAMSEATEREAEARAEVQRLSEALAEQQKKTQRVEESLSTLRDLINDLE